MSKSASQSCSKGPPSRAVLPAGEPKIITVSVQEVTQADIDSSQSSLSANGAWEPGVRKRFPWMGFAAFVVVFICVIATILVLWHSNGKQADIWCHGRIGPNVFLAIFSSLSNLAIAVAVGNGFAIAWWRRALSKHTVKDLHYSLSFSANCWQVFLKPRYFNFIALAALGTKITVIDSVLYQRALSSAVSEAPAVYTPRGSFAADVFPITATMGQNLSSMGKMTETFTRHVIKWMQMPLIDIGSFDESTLSTMTCEAHLCTFGIQAAGFAVDCKTSASNVDHGVDGVRTWSLPKSDSHQDLPLFSTKWSYLGPDSIKNYSRIVLNATYADLTDTEVETDDSESISLAVKNGVCLMNMTNSICEFRPAVLNYTVVQTNQKSELKSSKHKKDKSLEPIVWSEEQLRLSDLDVFDQLDWSCNSDTEKLCGEYDQSLRQIAGVKVMRHMDVTEPFVSGANSSLFGFYLAFKDFFTASATASWDGRGWSRYENGSLSFLANSDRGIPDGYCHYVYVSPLTDILSQINMLSAAIATDPSAYYYYNSDKNNPLQKAWEDFDGFDFDSFVKRKNYTAWDIFNSTYDLARPTGVFDPKQVTTKNITVSLVYRDIFYVTSWPFVCGAVAGTIVVIFCILPVYWGFWELGRKVSLDPFEIAYAFQSPVFTSAQTETGYADEVLKIFGKNNVQYSEIVDQEGRRYRFHVV